jgi:Ca2+/Na+ antiporter
MTENDQDTQRTRRELWSASGFGLLAVLLVVAGFVASTQLSWWLIAAGFLLCVLVVAWFVWSQE